MPLINAIRVVNFKYNNGHHFIQDDIFWCNGKNTVCELVNGGGKTVLVQLITALFVFGKYRDIGESGNQRKYSNLFTETTETPTIILVEWILDGDEEKYLITGMVVQKAAGTTENDSLLNMTSFIGVRDAGEQSEYSIDVIPIIEKHDKTIQFKTWTEIDEVLEKFKNENVNNFLVFRDMNTPKNYREYFKTLYARGIDRSEWEKVICSINSDEGAFEKYFKNYFNDAALLNGRVLPLIEKKLSESELPTAASNNSIIKDMQEAFTEYAFQYGMREADCDRKVALERYREDFARFEAGMRRVCDAGDAMDMASKELAGAAEAVSRLQARVNAGIQGAATAREKLADMEKMLSFEEQSVNLRKIEKKLGKLDDSIVKEREHSAQIKDEINDCDKEIEAEGCRRILDRINQTKALLAAKNTALDAAQKEGQAEQASLLKQIGLLSGQLKHAYACEHKDIAARLDEQQRTQDSLDEQIKTAEASLKTIQEKSSGLRGEAGRLTGSCEQYAEMEKQVAAKFGGELFPGVLQTPLGYSRAQFERRMAELKDSARQAASAASSAAEARTKAAGQAREANDRLMQMHSTLQRLKEQQKAAEDCYEKACQKREILKHAAEKAGLETDGSLDAEFIAGVLESKAQERESVADAAGAEAKRLEAYVEDLKTGNLTGLNENDLAFIRSLGIGIVFGGLRLARMDASQDAKQEILRRNPLLPHALVVPQKDMEKAAAASAWTVHKPTVFIAEEMLDGGETAGVASGNAGLLVRAPEGAAFLDMESIAAESVKVHEKIAEAGSRRKRNADEAMALRMAAARARENAVTDDELNRFQAAVSAADAEATKAAAAEREARTALHALQNEAERLAGMLPLLNRQESEAKALLESFSSLDAQNVRYHANKDKLQDVTARIASLKSELEAKSDSVGILRKRLGDVRLGVSRTKAKMEACEAELRKLADVEAVQPSDGAAFDVAEIKAKITVLKGQINGAAANIEMLMQEAAAFQRTIDESTKELNEKQQKCLGKDISKEPEGFEYVHTIEQNKKLLENQLQKSTENLNGLLLSLGKLQNEKERLESAIKAMEKGAPISVSEIERLKLWTYNFSKRRNAIMRGMCAVDTKTKWLNKHIAGLNTAFAACIAANVKHTAADYENAHLINCFEFKTMDGAAIERDVQKRIELYNVAVFNFAKEKSCFFQMAKASGGEKYGRASDIADLFCRDAMDATAPESSAADVRGFADMLPDMRAVLDAEICALGETLRDVEEKGRELAGSFYEYIGAMLKQLATFKRRTKIQVGGVETESLKMRMPKWDENTKPVFRAKADGALKNFRTQCLAAGRDADGLLSRERVVQSVKEIVTTQSIFAEIAGADCVHFSILKPGPGAPEHISWNMVGETASGGQRALASFIMLCIFLNYMRHVDFSECSQADQNGQKKKKNKRKVLILDNPFGKISSADLLRPFKSVAELYNVQLICFTAHSGRAIDEVFDNHYILSLARQGNGTSCLVAKQVKGDGKPEEDNEQEQTAKIHDFNLLQSIHIEVHDSSQIACAPIFSRRIA